MLAVVMFHTIGGAQSSNPLLRTIGIAVQAGWSGVTLFFVLSGFLITGILWDTRGSSHWWRNFYVRRILRISPLYYGALLLVAATAAIQHNTHGIAGLWVYALYLQNVPWIQDTGASFRPLPLFHFWSLAVEEQFYLFWPFLLRAVQSVKQAKRACIGIFLLSTAFRFGLWTFSTNAVAFNGFILSRSGELALGAYLAMSYRDGSWPRLQRFAPWTAWIALAAFLAACLPSRSMKIESMGCATAGLAFISLMWASVLVLCLAPGIWNKCMKAAWLRWIGKISYGAYVFHILLQPFYGSIEALILPHPGRVEELAVRAVITWVATALIAWLSYKYFESPILKLRKHFRDSSPREHAATVGVH